MHYIAIFYYDYEDDGHTTPTIHATTTSLTVVTGSWSIPHFCTAEQVTTYNLQLL